MGRIHLTCCQQLHEHTQRLALHGDTFFFPRSYLNLSPTAGPGCTTGTSVVQEEKALLCFSGTGGCQQTREF